jgi:hypothetical protein
VQMVTVGCNEPVARSRNDNDMGKIDRQKGYVTSMMGDGTDLLKRRKKKTNSRDRALYLCFIGRHGKRKENHSPCFLEETPENAIFCAGISFKHFCFAFKVILKALIEILVEMERNFC